jgi:hypothetical protein
MEAAEGGHDWLMTPVKTYCVRLVLLLLPGVSTETSIFCGFEALPELKTKVFSTITLTITFAPLVAPPV